MSITTTAMIKTATRSLPKRPYHKNSYNCSSVYVTLKYNELIISLFSKRKAYRQK